MQVMTGVQATNAINSAALEADLQLWDAEASEPDALLRV